jgi:hypothetical protein
MADRLAIPDARQAKEIGILADAADIVGDLLLKLSDRVGVFVRHVARRSLGMA